MVTISNKNVTSLISLTPDPAMDHCGGGDGGAGAQQNLRASQELSCWGPPSAFSLRF